MFCGWWTCDSILYDLTRHDIFVDNLYMLISIRASMLMPESHHMAQLMNNNPKLVTVFPDRYGLGTVSPLAHKWATPTRHRFYVLRLSCLQLIHLAMRCVRLYKQTLDINIKTKPFTSSSLNYSTYIHTAYKQPISITFIAK